MMKEPDSAYLAWQDPDARDWHVVGWLTEDVDKYIFRYTRGALASPKFVPFRGMEKLDKDYVSKELFPLFKNSLLSRGDLNIPDSLNGWASPKKM